MDPQKRNKYILAAGALVVILAAIYFLFIFQRGSKGPKESESTGEVKELAQIELAKRPYITLTPTADGAEIIFSVENMGNFDRIEYELIYLADNPQITGEKIQRGSTGTDINTKEAKYKKSLLLGTASRGARSPDTGITDGKLTMHMFQGDTEYYSETDWNMQQFGAQPSVVTGKSGNFKIELAKFSKEYWVIVADTIGLPPVAPTEFDVEKVVLPIYGSFSIAPNFPKEVTLSIVLSEDTEKPNLFRFVAKDNIWDQKDSTYNASTKTLTAKIGAFDTFVIAPSK